MIEILCRIKSLALEMRETTSTNDPNYEKLQDQIDLCDELMTHNIDDGR